MSRVRLTPDLFINNIYKSIHMIKVLVGITALVVGCWNPSSAYPSRLQDHKDLVEAVRSTGVSLAINPIDCKPSFDGFYMPSRKRMVVCQDLGTPDGDQVAWTEGDLNTLRHEAHHLVQGCMAGSNFDAYYHPLYKNLNLLIDQHLTSKEIIRIYTVYHQASASIQEIELELEASAVAAMDDPLQQIQDIKRYCF